MDVLKKLLIACGVVLSLTACHWGYLVKTATHQADILRRREPIDKALQSTKLTEDDKQKLRLALEAIDFAENDLGLKRTQNYRSFVQLDRPYVSYVLNAAPKNKLEHYLWSYPVVGKMPYKGFPSPEEAQREEDEMKSQGFDTFVRGVSAYSTLGWFKDPILSSMLRYSEHDLVNTLIHETVHATVFIKSQADFNERLAVFVGNIGTEMFYLKKEGEISPTLKTIQKENADQKRFSTFISTEIKELSDWYKQNPEPTEESRQARLLEIQKKFAKEVKPFLQSESYARFEKASLNNAFLMNYGLYEQDLADFETIYRSLGRDFSKLIEYCKALEGASDPTAKLRADALAANLEKQSQKL